ncbi:hypothetical protein PIB30_080611 [Stylosanthes scabra]|uniref:PB1-like domain-containing protein n=1 Tax=Stylosanthes scabra TaxID=79078 RepID=A0ABU6YP37_9FABA|nr:hypothetical protein [Stylosanthes scabra]
MPLRLWSHSHCNANRSFIEGGGTKKLVALVAISFAWRIAKVSDADRSRWIVFHVHGRFVRNDYGVYIYADGQAENFDPMDIDFVNYGDLLKLLEGIGYKKIKKMQWYDIAEDDLEAGLHKLEGDADINAMCEHLMRNFGLTDEFHIYVEHEVDIPVPASDEGEPNVEPVLMLTSSSSDDGGYESVEDELYKPRGEDIASETDTESEIKPVKKCKAKAKKKNEVGAKRRITTTKDEEKGKGVRKGKKNDAANVKKKKESTKEGENGGGGPSNAGPKINGSNGPSASKGFKYYQAWRPITICSSARRQQPILCHCLWGC